MSEATNDLRGNPAAASRPNGGYRLLSLILLAIFCSAAFLQILNTSVVVPEAELLPAGYTIIKNGDFRLDNIHPPLVKALAAAPLHLFEPHVLYNAAWKEGKAAEFGWYFIAVNFSAYKTYFLLGRALILGLGVFLAWHVLLMGRRLYGEEGGMLAFALFCLSPACIAFSGVVSTELPLALFGFLSVYYLIGILTGDPRTTFLMYIISAGMTLLTDFKGLVFLPIHLVVLAIAIWPGHKKDVVELSAARAVKALVWTAFSLILIVNAGYGFEGTFSPLGQFAFHSEMMSKIKAALPSLPSLLPRNYLEGLDALAMRLSGGDLYYFNGKISAQGWPLYFAAAWLMREPAGQIAVVALAAFSCVRVRPTRVEWMVFAPALFWLFFFGFSLRIDDGFRHAIPALPFLFAFAGRLGRHAAPGMRKWLVAFLATAVFAIAFNGSDQLSFFNFPSRLLDPGGKVLADANSDWGQHLPLLAEYAKSHRLGPVKIALTGRDEPKAYGIRYVALECRPTTGIIAISRSVLLGLETKDMWPRGCFDWLKQYAPQDRIKNAIFIYNIPPSLEPGRRL